MELICQASVVEESGKSFALRPYQVKGIVDKETYLAEHDSTKIESASLNRDDGGLLPDAYLHLVRKKAAN